jgi:hypothetical protein
MMGKKERSFAPLVNVSVEDLVPADLYWLLGTSVQEIGLFCTIEQAFLPQHVR